MFSCFEQAEPDARLALTDRWRADALPNIELRRKFWETPDGSEVDAAQDDEKAPGEWSEATPRQALPRQSPPSPDGRTVPRRHSVSS